MNYTGCVCPVCKKEFSGDDDIVTCPVCGTPHHRECYMINKRCANEPLHDSGFSYKVPHTADEARTGEADASAVKPDEKSSVPKNEDNRSENGTFGKFSAFPGENNPLTEVFSDMRDKSPEQLLIDGKAASYYEAAIKKNQRFYIPRFMIMDKTQKNTSWSIGAFFFPFAWTCYRKMYKLAAVILALFLVIGFASNSIYIMNAEWRDAVTECAEEKPDFYYDIVMYQSGVSAELTAAQSNFVEVTARLNSNYPAMLYYAFWLLEMAIRVVMGIFSTKLYRDKLSKNIDSALSIGTDKDATMSYLSKKYGTAPFIIAVLLAIFESTFLGII